MERSSLWTWTSIFVFILSGAYLVMIYYGDRTASRAPQTEQIPPAAAQSSIDGRVIYANRCTTCHQFEGAGIPDVFPPLKGSERVGGPPDNLVRVILNGLQGPLEVAGRNYDSVMPPMASQMTDDEIAAVVNYIQTYFGETSATTTAADVARIRLEGRKTPWTISELPQQAPANTTSTPASVRSRIRSGTALFTQYTCDTCHSVDAPVSMMGPSLFDVGKRLSKAQIYEAITDPDATIAEGYAAGAMSAALSAMTISDADLDNIVEYLASLKG